jgi:hypothetical protein
MQNVRSATRSCKIVCSLSSAGDIPYAHVRTERGSLFLLHSFASQRMQIDMRQPLELAMFVFLLDYIN